MENIPDSVQKEEIDALLLGLRVFYQTMGELTEEVSYDWQEQNHLNSFVLLQRHAKLTELLLRQVQQYPVFERCLSQETMQNSR